MTSLAQAPSVLRDLNHHVRKTREGYSSGRRSLSVEEQHEASAAKTRAQGAINSILRMIEHSTQDYEACKKTRQLDTEAKKRAAKKKAQAAEPLDVNQQFKADTETNLSTVKQTVEDMENSISNIVPNFDCIEDLPNLSKFSATLESVPLVGISNSTVQYVSTTPGTDNNIDEEWSLFDDMPGTPASGETTSLFSYKGSFFITIGNNVWAKTPRDSGDPELAQAINNWPEIFNPGWKPLGSCVPAGNAKCLVPYSVLSSNNTTLKSWLIMLNADGSLSYSSQEVEANMQFSSLPSDNGLAPNLLKAAYSNGSIWGYDADMILYEIAPNIDSTGNNLVNYTIKSQNTMANAILDLTAVDTGLVAARPDGNLWKLIVTPPADEKSGPTQKWTQWISEGGVTNLGAAAPGVILDLDTLTSYLKATYIDTQTALFPCIDNIQAFCTSHGIYLEKLMKYSEQWQDASGNPQKQQEIQNEASKFAISHCQAIALLLSENVGAADTEVTQMTKQLSQVNENVNAALLDIGNEIQALKETLNEEEQEQKELTAALWGAVAAAVVGIGLIIAAILFPAAAPFLGVAGGVLLIGGIVFTGVLGSMLGNLSQAIAANEGAIVNLTQSQTDLTNIGNHFVSLSSQYGALNSFWTVMYSICGQIQDLDSLGTVLLEDQSSIIAAEQDVKKIGIYMTQYVSILGSQGITPQNRGPEEFPDNLHSMPLGDLEQHLQKLEPNTDRQFTLKLEAVNRMVHTAIKRLEEDDIASYLAILRRAARFNKHIHHPYLKISAC